MVLEDSARLVNSTCSSSCGPEGLGCSVPTTWQLFEVNIAFHQLWGMNAETTVCLAVSFSVQRLRGYINWARGHALNPQKDGHVLHLCFQHRTQQLVVSASSARRVPPLHHAAVLLRITARIIYYCQHVDTNVNLSGNMVANLSVVINLETDLPIGVESHQRSNLFRTTQSVWPELMRS